MTDPIADLIGDYRAFTTRQRDAFSRQHRAVLTGQQFQNEWNEPFYVLFEDFTHVKFHRRALRDVVELQGGTFDGFHHVDDWGPAATGHGDRSEPSAPLRDSPRLHRPEPHVRDPRGRARENVIGHHAADAPIAGLGDVLPLTNGLPRRPPRLRAVCRP